MNEKKVALFDLDGVVFDTEPLYTQFWSKVFEQYHPEQPNLATAIKGQTLIWIYDRYFTNSPQLQHEITTQLTAFEQTMPFEYVFGFEEFMSQLHQLRGRVGRGHSKSYCILYTNNNNDIVQFRMKLMTSIQDGFTLAEKDLLLRGSGEFFGTRQHGIPDFKVANVVKDLPILEKAREAARYSVEAGEDFRQELKNRYKTLFTEIYH